MASGGATFTSGMKGAAEAASAAVVSLASRNCQKMQHEVKRTGARGAACSACSQPLSDSSHPPPDRWVARRRTGVRVRVR
eukprot:2979583-Prymnesium_polylepis.1